MATYEGKWRCAYCAAINRGRDMDCLSCGVRRGPDVEFFCDEDAPAVTDDALLKEAASGPDWLCETCGGSNRYGVNPCQTCGAPKGASRYRAVVEGRAEDFTDRHGDTTPRHQTHAAAPTNAVYARSPRYEPRGPMFTRASKLTITGSVVAAAVLLALATYLFTKIYGDRDVTLTVSRVEWSRSIEMEEYRRVDAEAWEGEVPNDATLVSNRRDVHHYDKVRVGSHTAKLHSSDRVRVGSHTERESYTERERSGTETYTCGRVNKGNGYFEDKKCTRDRYTTVTKYRTKTVDDYQTVPCTHEYEVADFKQVPVYRIKYSYWVMRWTPAQPAVARGEDVNPRWPETGASETRRESARRQSFLVHLQDAEDGAHKYEREVSEGEFSLYAPGTRLKARVNGFHKLISLAPPPAAGTY